MKKHSIDVANKVAHFELEDTGALVDLIKSEGIDYDFTPLTSGSAFVNEAEASDTKTLWDGMLEKGSPALKHVVSWSRGRRKDLWCQGRSSAVYVPCCCDMVKIWK